MKTAEKVTGDDIHRAETLKAENKASNTDVATVSIPESILLAVIALLVARRDNLIEAALKCTDSLVKIPAKLWRAALAGKVAPDDVTAFTAVYRAIRYGISLGIPKDNFKLMPIPKLRVISQGVLDGEGPTRESFNVAMNSEKSIADVLETFTGQKSKDKANELKARKEQRAGESKEDKFVRMFVATAVTCRKAGVNANKAFKLAMKKLSEETVDNEPAAIKTSAAEPAHV